MNYMSKEMKSFPLEDVLSIVSGRIMTSISGVISILEFMVGKKLEIDQIEDASKFCKAFILLQHPGFKDLDIDSLNLLLDKIKSDQTLQDNLLETWIDQSKLNLGFNSEVVLYGLPTILIDNFFSKK